MSLFRRRVERTVHSISFVTVREPSGGGDTTRYDPDEQLQKWLNDRPKARIITAQLVQKVKISPTNSMSHYFVVLEHSK